MGWAIFNSNASYEMIRRQVTPGEGDLSMIALRAADGRRYARQRLPNYYRAMGQIRRILRPRLLLNEVRGNPPRDAERRQTSRPPLQALRYKGKPVA